MQLSLSPLLLVLFVALKLTGVITWGWFWVLSPVWVPLVITFAISVIVFAGALLFAR